MKSDQKRKEIAIASTWENPNKRKVFLTQWKVIINLEYIMLYKMENKARVLWSTIYVKKRNIRKWTAILAKTRSPAGAARLQHDERSEIE